MSIPRIQITLKYRKIRNQDSGLFRKKKGRIQFLVAEAFAAALFCSFPKTLQIHKAQIIKFLPLGKRNQYKGDPLLKFKLFHELHLMFMDIGQRKGIRMTFLSIKTHRDSLHCPDIIHGTFLVKVGKGNMPGILINIDGGNRGRNLLNQCQPMLGIFFIGSVLKILQSGTSQSSGIPGWHCFNSFIIHDISQM